MIDKKRYRLDVRDNNSQIKDPLDESVIIIVNNQIITNIKNIMKDIYKINPNKEKSELDEYLNKRNQLFKDKSEIDSLQEKYSEKILDFYIGFLHYWFDEI